MGKVVIMDHPLVAHKLTIMRDKNTSVKDFRELVSEIGMLITYEATRDLPMTTKHIETPICEMDAPTLAGRKFVVVPILRAGLCLVDGVLRMAGRLAFPIYCFLLVEGFLHTHDFKKYALRMLGFALISEWPFDWAFFSGVYWGHQNVYFTLLLGLLAMKALDTYQTPEGMPALKGILGAAACFLAAALLHCDYDVLGLALILALYMTRKDKRAQCIAGAVFSLFEPVAPLAFGLVWFYSGERGGSSKLEQWAFYWFYPAHIFVLGILTNLLLFR